jgi:hypothetical protein
VWAIGKDLWPSAIQISPYALNITQLFCFALFYAKSSLTKRMWPEVCDANSVKYQVIQLILNRIVLGKEE